MGGYEPRPAPLPKLRVTFDHIDQGATNPPRRRLPGSSGISFSLELAELAVSQLARTCAPKRLHAVDRCSGHLNRPTT